MTMIFNREVDALIKDAPISSCVYMSMEQARHMSKSYEMLKNMYEGKHKEAFIEVLKKYGYKIPV